MSKSGSYPLGAEYDPSAPYNEPILDPIELDVLVSITLSKNFKIKTDDYKLTSSGDIDLRETDLKELVEDNIYLPNDGYKVFPINTKKAKKAYKDLSNWNVDELEVIEN